MPILRHKSLGNIHICHNLNSRNNRRLKTLRRRRLLHKHTVNSVLYLHLMLKWLNVYITRTDVNRFQYYQIHKIN